MVISSGSIFNKDVPSNSVVAGVPARIISTFEEFVHKHVEQTSYPFDLSPSKEEVRQELVQYLCDDFYKKRD